MPPRRERLVPNSTTNEVLVDAAYEVFNRIGYEAATVEDIRAEASVSRATFYFYFANKKEVLLAVMARLRSELVESLATIQAASVIEHIALINVRFMERWRKEAQVLMDISAHATRADFVAMRGKRQGAVVDAAEAILVNYAGRPKNDPHTSLLATTLAAMSEQTVRFYFLNRESFEEEQISMADLLKTLTCAWYRIIFEPPCPELNFAQYFD